MRWLLVSCVMLPGCLLRPEAHPGAGDGGGPPDNAASSAIGWDHSFVGALSTRTFTNFTAHAGDVVLIQVSCKDSAMPTMGITTTAPGWSIHQSLQGGMAGYWATLFTLVSPNTSSATFTISGCTGLPDAVGDAFANVDTVTPIDSAGVNSGTSPCLVAIMTGGVDDALWCASMYAGPQLFADTGWMIGTVDGELISEAKITSDPAGTIETATFMGGSTTDFVATAVALKPR